MTEQRPGCSYSTNRFPSLPTASIGGATAPTFSILTPRAKPDPYHDPRPAGWAAMRPRLLRVPGDRERPLRGAPARGARDVAHLEHEPPVGGPVAARPLVGDRLGIAHGVDGGRVAVGHGAADGALVRVQIEPHPGRRGQRVGEAVRWAAEVLVHIVHQH